jgi:hypothetical protein
MDKTTTNQEIRPLTIRQRNGLIGNLRKDRVKHKQDNAKLSYLESWDVIATLIKVFGYGGFSSEMLDSTVLKVETDVPKPGGGTTNFRATVMCTVKLTIHQTGAVYTEAAAASQSGSQIGEVVDFALKTAESDALKRAARFLGTQFGLSLYNDGDLTDVVGVVMAPGAECPPMPEELKAWNEWADGQDAIRAEMEAEQGNAGQASSNPRLDGGPAEGVTPEQHAANKALVDKAVRSRRQKDQEQAQPAETPA